MTSRLTLLAAALAAGLALAPQARAFDDLDLSYMLLRDSFRTAAPAHAAELRPGKLWRCSGYSFSGRGLQSYLRLEATPSHGLRNTEGFEEVFHFSHDGARLMTDSAIYSRSIRVVTQSDDEVGIESGGLIVESLMSPKGLAEGDLLLFMLSPHSLEEAENSKIAASYEYCSAD